MQVGCYWPDPQMVYISRVLLKLMYEINLSHDPNGVLPLFPYHSTRLAKVGGDLPPASSVPYMLRDMGSCENIQGSETRV